MDTVTIIVALAIVAGVGIAYLIMRRNQRRVSARMITEQDDFAKWVSTTAASDPQVLHILRRNGVTNPITYLHLAQKLDGASLRLLKDRYAAQRP